MPFRVQRSSADIRDGFCGSSCSRAAPKPSMQDSQYTWNGREPSATASQLGKTRMDGVATSARISRTNVSIAGVNANLTPILEKRVNRAKPLGQVGQTFAVLVDTTHQCTDLLHIRGHRHIDQCGHVFCVRAYARRGNGVAQEVRICDTQSRLRGGKL